MGLDNGIILKGITKEEYLKCPTVTEELIDEEQGEFEVAYWRKCWGIRNKIIDKFHFSEEGGDFKLDPEDIPPLLKILKKFLHPGYWDDCADSIWEYDEIIDSNIDIYIRLTWVKDYLEKHPEATLEFYDSY